MVKRLVLLLLHGMGALILVFTSCSNPEPPKSEKKEWCHAFSYEGMDYRFIEIEPDDLHRLRIASFHENQVSNMHSLLEWKPGVEWATNGGIYHTDFRTSGLFINKGKLIKNINTKRGKGNFYLKPNGVLIIEAGKPIIQNTEDYVVADITDIEIGIQSGPLLLDKGKIHPVFNEKSESRKLRSGVGIRKDGTLIFAISKGNVNFHQFASLFLNHLKCTDALYLDGVISEMYCKGDEKGGYTQNFATILYMESN